VTGPHQHEDEGDRPARPVPPPPYETVAALAAEVARLRTLEAQVADVRADARFAKAAIDRAGLGLAADMRAKLARLTADLDTLAAQVEQLAQDLADAVGTGQLRVQAPTWAGLSDDERAIQLGQLRGWVDSIMVPSYAPPEGTLRPCWYRHMSAVWELSTLAAEWKRIYQARSRDLQGALDFHDRWLPGALRRVREAVRPCTDAQCAQGLKR
jgi:hypothetical protein